MEDVSPEGGFVTVRGWALAGGRIGATDATDGPGPPEGPVWIDLVAPTLGERKAVEERYGTRLPDEEEIGEIEASSRHFQEDGLHLRSLFLVMDAGVAPRLSPVAFQVEGDRLYTLRAEPLGAFQDYVGEAVARAGMARSPLGIVLRLLEAKVDRLADVIEHLMTHVERRSEVARAGGANELEHTVTELAALRDGNDRVRLVLMDDDRALSFLLRRELVSPEDQALLREIIRDVDSLAAHSSFLSDRIDALLGETLGRIDIEQNKVVKIVSVMAVALLPPTLIASLYGMNFRYMPELASQWGYPAALVAMVLSGLVPFLYFKRKGWL